MAYAERFLSKYEFIVKAQVKVVQVPWVRAVVEGQPHSHAFVQGNGNERWAAEAVAVRGQPTTLSCQITGLVVLKTTQSGWERFHRNEYTLLPDTNERMMASSVTAIWPAQALPGPTPAYGTTRAAVRRALLEAFTGPAEKGEYSPGVQHTLHKMGIAALKAPSRYTWNPTDPPPRRMPRVQFERDASL